MSNPFTGMLSNEDEGFVGVVKEFFSPDNPETKTEVNDDQIKVIMVATWFRIRTDPKNRGINPTILWTEQYLPVYLKLKYSKDRQSRKEGVEMLKSALDKMEETTSVGEKIQGK